MGFSSSLIGVIMATNKFKCPIYTTVTLRLFPQVYTPPVSGSCVLKLLPCPYTPPIVV